MRKHPWSGAGVLVLKSKHGDVYFDATEDYKFNDSIEEIIRYNLELGCYSGDDEIEAIEILNEGSGREQYDFLMGRSDCEYENVEYCLFK